MAESAQVPRIGILVGFLLVALGFLVYGSVIFPNRWSSYSISQTAFVAGSALFFALFGCAFWIWLPSLGRSNGDLRPRRNALHWFDAASLLLALAYAADTYRQARIPYSGRSGEVVPAGFGIMGVGFAVTAFGFWTAARTTQIPSDSANAHPVTSTARQFPIPVSLVTGGLIVLAPGWILSIVPVRIAIAGQGAVSKSLLFFGVANALAFVVMAVGFAMVLVKRGPFPDSERGKGRPFVVFGCAFVALTAANLAGVYEGFYVFAPMDWVVTFGYVVQSAGALLAAVGFFVTAWSARDGRPGPQVDKVLVHT